MTYKLYQTMHTVSCGSYAPRGDRVLAHQKTLWIDLQKTATNGEQNSMWFAPRGERVCIIVHQWTL